MKTNKFLFGGMLVVACAMAFVGCKKDETSDDPFNKKDDPTPTPTTDVLTVAEAIAQQGASGEKTVKGYIVGWYNNHVNASQVEFGNTATADTTVNKANVVIADAADETVAANCVCVQLTAGQVRNIVELASNPENLGKELIVKGVLASYNGMAGVKTTSYSEVNGKKSTDAVAELLCYRVKIGDLDATTVGALKVGDVVTISAQLMRWYETPETSAGTFLAIGTAQDGAISVADALAICNGLEQTTDNNNKHVSDTQTITGTVSKITENAASTYSNMTFYIK